MQAREKCSYFYVSHIRVIVWPQSTYLKTIITSSNLSVCGVLVRVLASCRVAPGSRFSLLMYTDVCDLDDIVCLSVYVHIH